MSTKDGRTARDAAARDAGGAPNRPGAGDAIDRAGRSPTLRDVAEVAGVSVMTVSNVINRRFHTMGPQTRLAVEDAVRALNYRPHSSARSLRLAKRLSIGLMIVDPSTTFIADAFTTHVMAGLGNHLSQRGYALEVQGVSPDRLVASTLLRSRQCDGLCVLPSGDETARERLYCHLRDLGQPVVILQDRPPDVLDDAVSVRQADEAGGRELARHVIDLGARHLLFFREHQAWPAMERREAGVRGVCAEAGLPAPTVVAAAATAFEHARRSLEDHLRGHAMPDAILGGNDQLGIAGLKCVRDLGAAVPDDVQVTGFNGFDVHNYSSPTLTTVRSRAYDIGTEAGRAMLHRLTNGAFAAREIELPVTLCIAGSTGRNADI